MDDELTRRRAQLEKATALSGYPFYITKFEKTHQAAALKKQFEALANGDRTETQVAVAGRILSIRNNGMFIDIMDDSDKLQIFHSIKEISPETRAQLDVLDLGDIIGVTGLVRRTPRGEITVDGATIQLLSKALLPPPEKYHGLKDPDFRFRHREQDIVSTAKTRETLRARYKMVTAIRRLLDDKGFTEVETPMLHTIPGGANAKPFATHHNALDIPLYMRIAPELHLKRLIVGGLSEKLFEINRCFRNEGLDTRHNPEFTTLEIYQAYVDFTSMIEITETIVAHVAMILHGTTKISYDGKDLDFTPPWPRKTMMGLIQEHTGIDFASIPEAAAAQEAAAKIGVRLEKGLSWGQIVEAVFGERVEAKLIQPTHVIDLPKEISPLAKAWPDRPNVAQRFETYVNGWELANAFSELNDPLEQRARFLEQAEQKRGPDDPPQPIDENFIEALSFGMPPTGGMGMGLDRLAMLMTDSASIREVLAFPTMRPID